MLSGMLSMMQFVGCISAVHDVMQGVIQKDRSLPQKNGNAPVLFQTQPPKVPSKFI